MSLFPALFWPLALAHALALISPGPDTLLVLSHSMRRRLAGSFGICLGIAFGNAIYIMLAIAGWAGLRDHQLLYRAVELAGAAYLIWLGICLIRSARTGADDPVDAAPPLARKRQFALGLASALLNPKNMVFYLSIMTALLASDATLTQRCAAGMWMVTAVLVWDSFLAVCMSHTAVRQRMWRIMPTVEKVCGLILIALAVSMTIAPLVS